MMGLSPGKYLIYEQLIATGNKVSIDDIRNNSIRTLVDTYKISLLPNYKNIRIQKRKRRGTGDFSRRQRHGRFDCRLF